MTPVLEIRDLHVDFELDGSTVHAVRGLDLTLERGSCLGVVGESGCGKSVTMLAVMRLLPLSARVRGEIRLEGEDIRHGDARWRGSRVAMVFQDSMSSLNPLMRVGTQVAEVMRYRAGMQWRDAKRRAIEHLERVGLPDPARVARQYPHELSGGMRQRVMLASSLAAEPAVLIADEATTGLDVTVQAQIIDLLRELRSDLDLSVVFVSHDLGAIAELCDTVAVVYGGRVAESGPTTRIVAEPCHPYTQGLLDSFPRFDGNRRKLHGIAGSPPAGDVLDAGCPFRPRCQHAIDSCREPVEYTVLDPGWHVACRKAETFR